jgi:nucleotide-binding universal stress UspA family protein
MFSTIVVPLDGSETANRAFEVALNLAKAEGARLAVCSVVDPVLIAGTTPPSPAADLVLADMERESRDVVDAAVERAKRAGLQASGAMRLGVPFEEILAYAKAEKADAIVMGTHGRSGLRRLFIGSVAESVLRKAFCPVIVVRGTVPLPEGQPSAALR